MSGTDGEKVLKLNLNVTIDQELAARMDRLERVAGAIWGVWHKSEVAPDLYRDIDFAALGRMADQGSGAASAMWRLALQEARAAIAVIEADRLP